LTVTTNTSFDTYNAASAKWPVYMIEFDGVATGYCNHTELTTDRVDVGEFDDSGGEFDDAGGEWDEHRRRHQLQALFGRH
jgi:hypothetical protein